MANAGTACFVNVNGTIHAVVNWRQRRSKDDVIIGSKLSDEQAAQYVQLRQEGLSEADICDRLFPSSLPVTARARVSIDMGLLTKSQMVQLLRERTGAPLNTAPRLSAADLRAIVTALKPASSRLIAAEQ